MLFWINDLIHWRYGKTFDWAPKPGVYKGKHFQQVGLLVSLFTDCSPQFTDQTFAEKEGSAKGKFAALFNLDMQLMPDLHRLFKC